jgi:hypothetical protein
VRLL